MNEPKVGQFTDRHLGLSEEAQKEILKSLGHDDLEDFIASVVPEEILDKYVPNNLLPIPCDEKEALEDLRSIASLNQIKRSFIGLGYY